MIKITINMEVSDVMVLASLVVSVDEGRQTFVEEALNQLNIVSHLWEVSSQAEVTLQR